MARRLAREGAPTRADEPDPALVDRVHALLVRQSRLVYNRTQVSKHDAVLRDIRRLPTAGVFAALDAAVARDRRLKAFKVEILWPLADRPGAAEVIEREIGVLPRSQARLLLSMIIEPTVELLPMVEGILAQGARHPLIVEAIVLAASIGSKTSTPHISKLLRARNVPRPVADALFRMAKHFDAPESRPRFAKAFATATDPGEKLDAAWGLAKLGDEAALEHLHVMLYDRGGWANAYGGRLFNPGESLHAAMALQSVYGLRRTTGSSLVSRVRRHVASLGVRPARPRGPTSTGGRRAGR